MTDSHKVILVGIGWVYHFFSCHLAHMVMFSGATCSGKTTLAKHLNRILPDSLIIHQDVCCSSVTTMWRLSYLVRTSLLYVYRKYIQIFENHLILLSLFPQPQELVPVHPLHNVQDWDAAAGAISWDRLVDFLRHVKETGIILPDHRSHDHLNEQKEVKVEEKVREKWIKEFETIKKDRRDNKKIIWGLVDGFLLYWKKVSGPWFVIPEAHFYHHLRM